MKGILAIVSILVLICTSCEPKIGADNLLVENQPTISILSNGNSGSENEIGKKQVGLKFIARKDLTIKNIMLTYWDAGHNNLSKSIEFNTPHDLSPASDSVLLFSQLLPDSEKKAVCEAMYFMWTMSYQIKNDTSMGMYIGQPQLVMPTHTRKPNGTLEQALCAAPLDASE
ncbi:MAG: hypothetical protein IPH74_07195 [Bacteroidetes bacterium]|jgi:hypothetical protein|nr:hypothetical protein [Bacteroidota bacterium]MBP7257041.1 hypothetical protein [Chitinophagales bacterium]MBK7138806.1 hypothetical protein [Bacteroidota bacterium]MBK7505829.1 hypothetical protein [Bacteroidota bacterium]MBK7640499.1 hypothetical protein [Bacteroidota bacterium]